MEQGRTGTAGWEIIMDAREEKTARYAVVRGGKRVVWGLRDEAAAARWLRRLSGPVQASLGFEVDAAWRA